LIKETLEAVKRENLTFAELARGLGIDESGLKNRLELLERMGYLKGSGKVGHEAGCSGCNGVKRPLAGFLCTGCVEKEPIELLTYSLTEKGKRISGN